MGPSTTDDWREAVQRSTKPRQHWRPSRERLHPLRPYCTQACMHSLNFDLEPDYGCPNILLHLHRQRRDPLPEKERRRILSRFPPRYVLPDPEAARQAQVKRSLGQRPARHPLPGREVACVVRKQLESSLEQDLRSEHLSGHVGRMFKMTLTGFGYTLMAKATQGHKSELLGHELRTYRDLADQQGVRIPVCLGVMRLERPYVESWFDEAGMPRCVALTDMMLMSYVGRDIRSLRIRAGLRQRGNDVEGRAYITQMELWHLGLDSTGYNNLTWCEELGRVMRVDFDHAHVDAVKRCITCRSDRLNHRRPHPITGKLASRLPFAKLGWDDCTWGRSPFAQVRDVRPSDMAIEALFLA